MLTLRIESGNGHPPDHRQDRLLSWSVLLRSDGLAVMTESCPRCQRYLTAYRFTTDDGLPIITYHCTEHGDVIPKRDLAHDHP